MSVPLIDAAKNLQVQEKRLRKRTDLPFVATSPDGHGIAHHWDVPHDPTALYAQGQDIGRAFFNEVAKLAAVDPDEALRAMELAMNSPGWNPGGWGIESGFSRAMAEAALVGLQVMGTQLAA